MTRRARIAHVALSGCALAALAALCVAHRRELGAALGRLSPMAFAAAVVLHGLTLVARAESWRMTLAAIERRSLSRRAVHAASAAGFAAGAIEAHLALPARVGALKRLAPDEAPRVTQMLLSDVPLMALEGFCGAVLLVVAAEALPALPWWSVPVVLAAAASGLVALRLARRRLSAHALAGGLAILEAPDLRGRLAGLTATIVGLSLARISILLAACGIGADPAHVALTYLAVTGLGLLPIGPAGNPAATVVTVGAAGVGAATAAGLALAASTLVAVVIYAAAVGVVATLGGRRRPRPSGFRSRPGPRARASARSATSPTTRSPG